MPFAVACSHVGVVRALLAEGADPLATDYMYRTCLHYAALCNWGPVIDELLGGRHLWRPESSPWQPAGKPPDEATFLKDALVHDIGGISRYASGPEPKLHIIPSSHPGGFGRACCKLAFMPRDTYFRCSNTLFLPCNKLHCKDRQQNAANHDCLQI